MSSYGPVKRTRTSGWLAHRPASSWTCLDGEGSGRDTASAAEEAASSSVRGGGEGAQSAGRFLGVPRGAARSRQARPVEAEEEPRWGAADEALCHAGVRALGAGFARNAHQRLRRDLRTVRARGG